MNTHYRSAILITHGTDTLAWTHAAVRYAVKHNKVNLSIPEIQIRLAYLMGHRRQIEAYCQSHGTAFMDVVEWLFMSGMKFRTHRSRRKYEELRGVAFDKRDLLIDYTMEESLQIFHESTNAHTVQK